MRKFFLALLHEQLTAFLWTLQEAGEEPARTPARPLASEQGRPVEPSHSSQEVCEIFVNSADENLIEEGLPISVTAQAFLRLLESLRPWNTNQGGVCEGSSTDISAQNTQANHYPSRLKSHRGRRNARPAALIINAS